MIFILPTLSARCWNRLESTEQSLGKADKQKSQSGLQGCSLNVSFCNMYNSKSDSERLMLNQGIQIMLGWWGKVLGGSESPQWPKDCLHSGLQAPSPQPTLLFVCYLWFLFQSLEALELHGLPFSRLFWLQLDDEFFSLALWQGEGVGMRGEEKAECLGRKTRNR